MKTKRLTEKQIKLLWYKLGQVRDLATHDGDAAIAAVDLIMDLVAQELAATAEGEWHEVLKQLVEEKRGGR